jgi:hypothetical protein
VAAATVYAAKGSGTVNGFRCTNYEGTQGGQKVAEICAASTADASLAASDFEVMQKMREFMSKMPMVAGLARAGITENGVNGMPVQTTRFTNGKATSREDVKSIANAAFTDADFSTGDAKKVDMPGMSGRGKGR